jgi:hypothetical protein
LPPLFFFSTGSRRAEPFFHISFSGRCFFPFDLRVAKAESSRSDFVTIDSYRAAPVPVWSISSDFSSLARAPVFDSQLQVATHV